MATTAQLVKAQKEGKTVERFCYTNFEKKEVWSKVIYSNFEVELDQYRIVA
jgi:hypothetical protein